MLKLDSEIFSNSLAVWISSVSISVFSFLGIVVLRKIFLSRLKKKSANTRALIDGLLLESLRSIRPFFILLFSIYFASLFLQLSNENRLLTHKFFTVSFLIQIGFLGSKAISFWIDHFLKQRTQNAASAATTVGLISFVTKLVFYTLITLLILHNLGLDISTLVTGLGVGGIAVALAVKNILEDLFASLTIVLDKPFVVGDHIALGEFRGRVEHIGLKNTRVRSFSGEQVIFPNSDLLQSRLRNFKDMLERRVALNIGVTYQTPLEKLSRISVMIQEIVEHAEGARFERCHFLNFGASSLDFETIYWSEGPDFKIYAETAHKINLAIFEKFQKEGIDFAYPTQTLILDPKSEAKNLLSEKSLAH